MLGAGTFMISEPLVLDRNNVELAGDQELTILKLTDRVDIPLLVVGDMQTPPARRTSGVVVRKLVLDGNRKAQDHECNGGPCDRGGLSHIRNNALTIRGAEDVRIEHVTARAARSGGVVLEKECRRIHISDFTAHDNHYDGFAAYETEDSYFTRLFLHSNAAAGISADIRFNRNIVSHSLLENNGSQGIFMRDSNFNNFSRLTIRNNGQQGVFIAQADDQPHTPCTGNLFSELRVTECKGSGLRVNDLSCVANTLVRSFFKANGQGGVSEVGEKLLAQVDVNVE
jgi:Right handed beta helix region